MWEEYSSSYALNSLRNHKLLGTKSFYSICKRPFNDLFDYKKSLLKLLLKMLLQIPSIDGNVRLVFFTVKEMRNLLLFWTATTISNPTRCNRIIPSKVHIASHRIENLRIPTWINIDHKGVDPTFNGLVDLWWPSKESASTSSKKMHSLKF